MRALLLAADLERAPRLALAAVGLAGRGHEVLLAGSPATRDDLARLAAGHVPDGARVVPAGWAAARERADVVLADGRHPLAPALLAGLARAAALVLELRPGDVDRWRAPDRWAWDAGHAWGLVEEGQAAALEADARGLDLERVALWSPEAPPEHADPAHPDVEVLERAGERALARRRGRGRRAGVFLDRDGTLVVERGYLSDPDDLELLPGVAEALRRLRAAGHALVVVSNQSGVGRGLFPLARVHEAMARLRALLRAHGAEPDAIWFCPHRPEDGCACRKPGIALLQRAAEDLQLDLPHSFVVGDKLLDAATGRNAGARGILVRSGYGREEEARAGREGAAPDHVADDLAAAADWIVAHSDPDA